MKEIYKKACEAIAQHYGFDRLNLCMEEAAELIQAVSKYIRIVGGEASRSGDTIDEVVDSITDEMADVLIMIKQVRYLLNISDDKLDSHIRKKIHRTLDIMELEQN